MKSENKEMVLESRIQGKEEYEAQRHKGNEALSNTEYKARREKGNRQG